MSRSGTGVLVFDYTAKCGLRQTETIDDPDLLDAAGAMLRRRKGGIAELLVYRQRSAAPRSWNARCSAYSPVDHALRPHPGLSGCGCNPAGFD